MKIKVDKNETIEIGKKGTATLLLASTIAFVVSFACFVVFGSKWYLITSPVAFGAVFCSGILMMTLYHAIRIDKGLETTVEDKKGEKGHGKARKRL